MAGASAEKFEEYFQKADADRDGRISGAEAVAFLQGSNLPRQVLAQIWTIADQNRTGFLSRPEFYNALKLVTVAQSKRELTKDIVNAALYTPASGKIPPPQINVPATPGPQPSPVAASPLTLVGSTPQPSSQNLGFRGPAPPSSSFNQQPGTVLSTSGMTQQLRPMPSTTGMNQQFGMVPSSLGVNQQLLQGQSASPINQQFGQAPPTNTSMNRPFGQLQPSSTGMNQQYGQVPPNTNPQIFHSHSNLMRPPLSMATGPASSQPQASGGLNVSGGMTGVGLLNTNNGWSVGSASGVPATQVLDRGVNPSISAVGPNSQHPLSSFSGAKDPQALASSGIGPNSSAMFAGDLFSANQSSSQKVSSALQQPISSLPTSSAALPVSSSVQPSAKPDPFEALQSTIRKPSAAVPAAQTQYVPKSNQQVPTQITSSGLTPGLQTGMENATSGTSQISWPKMTRASIQKYAKVFMEQDTDRDGKITGDQARNLFLSWRLPREVLKQIWDLSDQDSDSMLSLREFCIALYWMERYREGNPLPSVIPNSVMLDETLVTLVGPPTAYGGMAWSPASGLRQQQGIPGSQPVSHAGSRPPMQPVVSQADGSMQFNQNSGGRTLDNSHGNQHSNGLVNSLDVGGQEAAEATGKVDNKDNVLLDSREKLEYYRTKMQDLVLYKSRCDNRLNEITERARADKSEAELLEKKYQEKYKQVAEIHSKLTIEEASFRDIQERKMELQQAITKMEQGGSADGILQVRADRIQSDLEELLKALAERCKKHSIEVNSAAIIELPQGWQPGVPEIAAVWDEDWDKFDDEGFSFDVSLPENGKSASLERENSSPTHSYAPDSPSNASEPEKPFVAVASAFDEESVFGADESKSPHGSPERPTPYESPSNEYSDGHFRKSSDGDTETHRGFNEPSWGDFDNNDDIDSVWGFNTKDPDGAKNGEKYFFGSNDFGASPERSSSPRAESAFPKSNLFFEDSVPSTPLTRAGDSPRYGNDSRDPFESFSRYDSFSPHDNASSPRGETHTRFDSMSSSRGFDHGSNYSFDDSDPFGSSGPFKVS
ncbi:epidermal growth factor receptor substrate 15-like 1 [Salvia hispanica]|uniref:epidermal growth factor receptor substrate 15-like 1 n=1 Tax=Salvia hispanica TaxID=49212 RepID=UPI0020096EBD|nr:epidermal growth factor receptor substrate 15-like 1 [Salvia hispanica]